MTTPADTSVAARRAQLEALRRLGPEGRAELAAAMSDDAREIALAGIRHRHPEWSEEEARRALVQLLLRGARRTEPGRGRPPGG